MFDFRNIETKWQKIWEKEGIYKSKDKIKDKKNFYHLVMFPYPSGDLHIGHWYNFAPTDVYARMKKMQGYNVLSPMGFDSFGLPAENAAIKHSIHPKDWTYKNIKTMTKQLKSMGNIYDWSRMVITSNPDYYKWTQWMFLQLYKNGLAYRKKAPANWCPKCHTVLANEQVVDGRCERCETEVAQREIEQWLFRITKYAERLLKDLDKVDWPEKTKTMQRNWIGQSRGAEIEFKIKNEELRIRVFTTRLDTIFGCTYLVVAPEHSLIENLKLKIENFNEVRKYIEQAKKKTELQRMEEEKGKTGVELKGIKAINPFDNEEVPIFVADYILGHYGTGAVMAVPAHDERDFEFAKKYGLKIRESISGGDILKGAFTEDGILVNSSEFAGLTSSGAREKMVKWLEKNKLGEKQINYKLHDWLISRQRYWGAPIPIVYCQKCARRRQGFGGQGEWPVPEKDLPVLLPNIKNYLPTEEGKSPLAHSKSFINAKCPKCKGQAIRETDTMDTFVCSSWYYLRYTDSKNKNKFARAQKIKAWLPVNMYIGGAEHSVLHLLYSRFFTKALKDFGYLNFDEPFSSLRHQGVILGLDGQKMSKSRGNVVDPDDLIKKFGSDTVKMYLCFMGPYDQGGPWQPTGILGIQRFLQRVYKLTTNDKRQTTNDKNKKLEFLLHKTIKKVTEDIENFRFNTAISALMILFNEMEHTNSAPSPKGSGNANAPMRIKYLEIFLKLLAPFAPHLTEELWQQVIRVNPLIKKKNPRQSASKFKSIHQESWPKYNPKLIKEKKFELVIQINGKIRDKVSAKIGITRKEAEELIIKREKIRKILKISAKGGPAFIWKKIIYVQNRLINIII